MVQARALTTYVQRIYYPFLMREPLKRSQGGTTCLLWLHTPFLGPQGGSPSAGNAAQLSCMAVIGSLAKLPLALQHLKAAAQSASESFQCCFVAL